MKKLLIFLTILFSFIIFNDNVLALDASLTSDEINIKKSINELYSGNYINSNELYTYNNFVDTYTDNYNKYYYVSYEEYTSASIKYRNIHLFIFNELPNTNTTNLIFTFYFYDYRYRGNKYLLGIYSKCSKMYTLNLNNGTITNPSSTTANIEYKTINYNNNNEILTNFYLIDTNIDLIYSNYKSTSSSAYLIDNLYIDNKLVSYGDIIYTNNGIFNFNKKYSFNETIHTLQEEKRIHKLIVNFNLPNERDIDFNIDYSATSHVSKRLSPIGYLIYKKTFNGEEISQILNTFDDGGEFNPTDDVNDTYTNYSDTYGIDLSYDENDTLQLIIDFDTFIYNIDFDLEFTSNIPFEVSYIEDYDSTLNDSWTTIDLNGKYAVYFIPKVLNTDIYAQFDLSNEMKILYLEDYTNESANKIDYGKIENYFNKEFHFNNLNQAIKIINPEYGKNSNINQSIGFNPNLFNYVLQEMPNYNIEITNPNTGEIITTGLIDYNIEQMEEEKKINGINDLWKYLNKSLKNNNFFTYIKNIYSKIRQNNKIGNYFLLIIITSLIILLIKSFRR